MSADRASRTTWNSLAAGLLVAAGLIARIALPAIHRFVVAPEQSAPAREANATR